MFYKLNLVPESDTLIGETAIKATLGGFWGVWRPPAQVAGKGCFERQKNSLNFWNNTSYYGHQSIKMKKTLLILMMGALLSCGGTDKENSTGIRGLAPVDVYLNMEKQGFTTTKNLGTESGNFWDCKMSQNGVDYQVNIYSSNNSLVENVKATAMLTSATGIAQTKQFFIYISSLPYDNSDPGQASEWIDDNFDNDKATKIIGDAKFTIFVPSEFARMMTVEKNK